jgi:DNA polymerase-3 subunit beta
MKFIVNSKELKKALSKIIGVIPKKSNIINSIQESLLFDLEENKLNITACDVDLSMKILLWVTGLEYGSIVIPAKRLFDIVKNLPSTDIEFFTDNSKIILKTGNGEYELTGESSHNYPSLPSFESAIEMNIHAETLNGLINRTISAVSNDEYRKAMTGILFQIQDNRLLTVATNGHILARVITNKLDLPTCSEKFIIQTRPLKLLSKLIAGNIKINFNKEYVKFDFVNGTLYSRLIDEQYPNYEEVITSVNYTKKLIIDRNELISNVKWISLYSESSANKIQFSFSKNQVVISAKDNQTDGEAKRVITCEYEDEDITLGFNPKFIIEVLSNLKSKNVLIEFNKPYKAFVFRDTEWNENEDVLMIAMPLRI